ncbi:MAG TPA: DUF4380 domain-containing protein [Fimbriimonas sp.]|nr:DUF4380 domain-containing protein [Fimbriimonas sp.]
MAFLAGVIAAGLWWSAAAAPASVSVDKTEYHGWKDCWRISNGSVELVVVPQIGRIMRFGYVSGPNMLWENPDQQGKAAPDSGTDWINYGGDKLWPAPQKDWNWPPDSVLDRGELSVRATGAGLIAHGKPSSGLVFEREIKMDAESGVVTILDRLTNVSKQAADKSVWEICQTDNPDSVVLPISKTDDAPNGWIALAEARGIERLISPVGDDGEAVRIQRDSKEGRKIGSQSHAGHVTVFKGDTTFNMSTDVEEGLPYPDGGCPEEVYLSPDPAAYVELELLGPIRHLTPGQSTSIEVRWELSRAGKSG